MFEIKSFRVNNFYPILQRHDRYNIIQFQEIENLLKMEKIIVFGMLDSWNLNNLKKYFWDLSENLHFVKSV